MAPADELDLLVDGGGLLRHTFTSLWRTHALAPAVTRTRLEAQVRAELSAQVEKVRDVAEGTFGGTVTVDSALATGTELTIALPLPPQREADRRTAL